MEHYVLYIVGSTLLLACALLTTFGARQQGRSKANHWLAAYFWNYATAAVISYLVLFGYALQWPHLFRLAYLPSLVFIPCSYWYLRSKWQTQPIRLHHLLPLLPVLVFLVDYLPFYLQSAEEKRVLIAALTPSPMRMKLEFGEGWFMPAYGYTIIRYVVAFGYWLAQVMLLLRAQKKPQHPWHSEPHQVKHWLLWLVGSQALIFVAPLASLVKGDTTVLAHWINIVALIASLVQGYYLLMHPEVLQSSKLDKPDTPPTDLSAVDNMAASSGAILKQVSHHANHHPPKAMEAPFSHESILEIGATLDRVMHGKQLYLNTSLKLYDIARETGLGMHKISYYLNHHLETNFNGYLNGLRIAHFRANIGRADLQTKTLEALAEASGFQSRSTFIRAFKQATGLTPSEYLQQMKA